MSKKKLPKHRRSGRQSSVGIGTWPTPEKPRRKKIAKKKKSKRRTSPRAIDTVPLPEKPRRKKIAKKKKSKRRTSPRAIDTVPLPEKLGPLDLGKRLRSNRPKKGRKKVPRSPKPIIRRDFYRGHELRIETTYKITIDGKRVSGHLDVTNSGQVHYHPLPNRSTASAIDMVRAIIDAFPDEFDNSKRDMRSKARKVQMKKVASKKKATTMKVAAGKAMVKARKRSSGSRRKGGR